ncbi:MAG TPA: copper transporter [Nocardioidaceae bacterium]|nr:copper transporter [Nocardioidaceae bacterium]
MTRLRYAVVLVSVVLFTLALGIALGGGPLQGQVRGTLQSQVEAVTDGAGQRSLVSRNRALARTARFDRGFAEAVSPQLLEDRLTERSVVVLSLPGVPAAVTEAVAADIDTAGGTVTTSLQVGRDLVDPTARPLVDELSKRLLADLDDRDVPDDASVYTRAGVVAARALLTTADAGNPMDDAARSVFNTLTTARLLHGPEPQQRASTAVVLLPEARRRPGATSGGRSLILTELVTAFDEAGDGVVVGGPPSAAQPRGLLAALRRTAPAAEQVSTVDSTGVRAGQVVAVLALAEQAEGSTGHYGVAPGADAVLPADALTE